MALVSFEDMTIPAGDERDITASMMFGGTMYTDTVTVEVDLGDDVCVVSLIPAPTIDVCDVTVNSADENPRLAGHQQSFTVETDCLEVELFVDDSSIGSQTVVDGEILFEEVSLPEGTVEVRAAASGNGRLGSFTGTYLVDTNAPILTFEIASTIASPDNDLDPSTEAIDFLFEGASDLGPGTEISLGMTVEDEEGELVEVEVGVATTDDDGAWSAVIALDDPGLFPIHATATDACQNEGRADSEITVFLEDPPLLIVGPLSGTHHGIDDDASDATGYQLDLTLLAGEIPTGTEITVRCRPNQSLPFSPVGGRPAWR